MDPLIAALRKVRRRMAFQQWILFNVKGLLASLTACVLLRLLTRLFPTLAAPEPLYLAFLILGVVGATAWAIYRRPSLRDAALETDRRLALQERLTSSLELANVEGPMVDALHVDARQRLAEVDVPKAFPFYPPRMARWLLVPVLAFAMASFVPEIDLFGLHKRQAEAKAKDEARRVQAERLDEVARRLKENTDLPKKSELDAMALSLEKLSEQLESGEINEKQALAKLTNLTEELQKHREALQQQGAAFPELPQDLAQNPAVQNLAKSIQDGNFKEAAKAAKELQEKLKDGNLSEEEKKKLTEGVKKLAEALKSGNLEQKGALSQELADALAKAGESLAEGSPEGLEEALEGLEATELSLKDLQSVMEQMDKLNMAMGEMMKWQQDMLGPSEFCRMCGMALKPCKHGKGCKGCGQGHTCYGFCDECAGGGEGLGMRGPGRGRGNTTGPLDDVDDAFDPTMLQGQMTQGKALLDIVQRTTPNPEDAQPTTQYLQGVLVEAEQEAEQALTKEEIPAGSKEFVRQYFGSLDPESRTEEKAAEAPAEGAPK